MTLGGRDIQSTMFFITPDIELLYAGDAKIIKSEFFTFSFADNTDSGKLFASISALYNGNFETSITSVSKLLLSEIFSKKIFNNNLFQDSFLKLPHIPLISISGSYLFVNISYFSDNINVITKKRF